MWSFFSEPRIRQLSVGWSAVIIIGIFVSDFIRVLPSIGVAGLFLTSLAYSISHKRIAQRARCPEVLSFTLIYIVHVVSAVTHSKLANEELQRDLLLQLPFLLLPVAFILLPSLLDKHKNGLWMLLIVCCLFAASRTTFTYLLNYQEINQHYTQSGVMPTVPDHIRFSLLVSIAILAGTILAFNKTLPIVLRRVIVFAVLILFVFQHLLAVRSGLVTMYVAGVLWLGWVGWQQRRWKAILVTVTLVSVLAIGCMLLFLTLRNKVVNTRYDVDQIELVDAANNYSITGRVYSYKIAWVLIQQYPWLGVSKVQMNEKISQQYEYLYPEINVRHYLMPHNQFIYNLLAYGAIGLLVFLISFYYPLYIALRNNNAIMVILYVIITLSFLVEYTLETHIGILTGIFFLLLAAVPASSGPPVRQQLRSASLRLA